VMAPSGIRFERQEGCPCMVKGTRPGVTLPDAAQAGDRCNKAPTGRSLQQGGASHDPEHG
jgi:hypothetical protein